jgi:hypothetical protein
MRQRNAPEQSGAFFCSARTVRAPRAPLFASSESLPLRRHTSPGAVHAIGRLPSSAAMRALRAPDYQRCEGDDAPMNAEQLVQTRPPSPSDIKAASQCGQRCVRSIFPSSGKARQSSTLHPRSAHMASRDAPSPVKVSSVGTCVMTNLFSFIMSLRTSGWRVAPRCATVAYRTLRRMCRRRSRNVETDEHTRTMLPNEHVHWLARRDTCSIFHNECLDGMSPAILRCLMVSRMAGIESAA